MVKRTDEAVDTDCLFDLDLLDQMCSGLEDGMQDKLDLELTVESIDESADYRDPLTKHEVTISNGVLEDVSLPSCEFSDGESNADDCLSWNILLNDTSTYEPLKQNNLICRKKEKSSETLRFPELLKTILDEEQHSSIMSWQNNGRAFAIHDQSLFEAIVMPLHFKTSKWKSFQKQLNVYDFQKVTGQRRVYNHQYFVKDEPVLMTLMKREKVYPRHKMPNIISSHPIV